MAKTAEKIHGSDSSMDFEDVKSKVFRLFGRERPVHSVLGGGRPADLLLWKDKKASAVLLGSATTIWVLFELMEYHLLSLACHCLIFSSVILFLWSKTATFINKSPPRIPEFSIPEDLARSIALSLRFEINRSLATLKEIASGRDLKKFLAVIAGLWILSIIGNFCSFITLLYIVFVLLHSVPLVYDKYEDAIDFYGEKVSIEIKKQYAVLESKVLKQIPMGPSKKKKN